MVTKSVFQVIHCTENGDNRKDVEKVEPSKVNLKKQQQQKQHFFACMLLCNLFQIINIQNLPGPPSEYGTLMKS